MSFLKKTAFGFVRFLSIEQSRPRQSDTVDFMFELTRQEITDISHIVTSSGIKFSKRVTAFSKQGVGMLSSVLRRRRAIQVNIQIMRAFAKLRQTLSSHDELKAKIEAMEKKYDENFKFWTQLGNRALPN